MNLSRKWLNEFVDGVSAEDINDRDFSEAMTISGSKVEVVTCPGDEIENVVVGKVTAMERHPDSDHMWTCMVDIGKGEDVQIVTGAQNVSVGDLVPVAKHNSLLPGGVKITKGKLRGVMSNGMLCSLKELGLDLHDFPYAIEDGIWILQEEGVKPGDDIRPIIGADDHIVEFEITPNRPDCLSVIGLAREASATFKKPLKLHTPQVNGYGGSIGEMLDVDIEDARLCPRYTARMVKNVKIAPSPKWMRERLRASGVRPINNIVDITNYVMLEYGQPMHAFDFSCVEGGHLIIRTAREGEVIQTLDGNDRQLSTSMLCICDEKKPVCVAGVMGGANSEIVGDTAAVIFESANFNGVSVRRTATALGMRTDASSRYEKGLDPMNTYLGVQRACELVEMLGCGEVVDGIIDVIAADRNPTAVKLEPEKINGLLGTDIPRSDMVTMLESLGFTIEGDDIIVPSWRSDIEHYSDIAEEVARLYGYNKLPTTLMCGMTTMGGLTPKQKDENTLGALCRGLGYSEILTYSFISPSAYKKICQGDNASLTNSVTILNPLGEDTSVMRTTSLPSMLDILSRNYNYRNSAVRLYELAKTYRPVAGRQLADEKLCLTLGAYGGMDFFKIKGAVETILAGMRVTDVSYTALSENPSYHPGRCAEIRSGSTVIGVVGQIHPTAASNYGIGCDVYAAELDFEAMRTCRTGDSVYVPIPKYPSVSRDLAVVCDAAITVSSLEQCISRNSGGLVRSIELFDIYTGSPIPEGKKSVAFSLELRADDRNLTAAEADSDMALILAALEKELGAVIR